MAEPKGGAVEQFLIDVFRVLGYSVSSTRTSGDHGIDIIAERAGERLGIQVKGYEAAVGNGAVQEAVGRHFYRCRRCVVITKADLLRSPGTMLQRTNCLLIDGSQIPDLIAGKIL